MKNKLIELLGGYPTIDDAIEAIKTDKDRNTILTLSVKKLFNTLGSDDILRETASGDWMFEGKIISDAQKKILISEATTFNGTSLWKILQADVKYQANRKMFLLSETEHHLVAGKLWLHTLDAFRTRLNSMLNGKGSFNSK